MRKASPIERYSNLIAIAILVLGLAFYLYRIDQWFMHDDEGGYCYAAWRISEGEVPYRDFLTPQLPLFLYWGGVVVRLFGPSMVALRYVTVAATLLAAFFVYLTFRAVLGHRSALLSLPLFLMHKDVYFIARFFRPEAYMLLFLAMGLYAFVPTYRDRRWWGSLIAGALLGLAMLCKLFAALAFAGCVLFLLCRWLRFGEKRAWGHGVALSAGFALTVGTVFFVFQARIPYFFTAVLGHHAMQGAELSLTQVLTKALRFYWEYFKGNPAFLLLAAMGALRAYNLRAELAAVFVWQIPTAATFLVLSRDLQDRHLLYLVPALSALAAYSLQPLFGPEPIPIGALLGFGSERKGALGGLAKVALGLLLVTIALWPSWRKDLEVASWNEDDTWSLARYIQAHTLEDDYVLCDYPGLNFHAQRKNTYLGAGLSGGATSSGQITGAALIREIEADDMQMVLINTSGGAHQLVNLHDYADFRRYVQNNFSLIRMFNRSYQTFEIYHRDERMPLLPEAEFGGKLALTGADLGSAAVQAGQKITVTLRWQALNAMERDYTVSLRLVDGSGRRYSQHDIPLLRTFTARWEGPREIIEQAGTSRWTTAEVVMDDYQVLVPHGTPPGQYRLLVLLYDLTSGQVLQTLEGDEALGSEYVLGSIEVARPREAPYLDELPIHRQVMQDFGDQLQLLGHAPIVEQARPGDVLHLALFWRSLRQMERDWQFQVRILGTNGEVVVESQFELANAGHPTSQWADGEVVLGYYGLALDRSAPSGQARIVVDLVDADTGRRLLGHDWVLANFSVEGRPRSFELPAEIQYPLTANFGHHVLLLGYDLDNTAVRPGSTVELTLYWQALAEMETSYTVFTHLLDAQERVWGQNDSIPVQGTYPTTAWVPGEVVTDAYEIGVDAGAPPGRYVLEIGLYDAATGKRLPVLDAEGQTLDNRILLSPVQLTD
jgi:4-amino-4-deoxy-L-arabinose transferase-like glycosyltransferase